MAEQWIDWHPKVGDIRPEVYRVRFRDSGSWSNGEHPGRLITMSDLQYNAYQIPAPEPTPPEDRPPWIDPQCKFRWGDRVKDKAGNVWFVNNPWDMPEGTTLYPVTCTKSLWDAAPYSCYRDLNYDDCEIFNEQDLELFPEDLPQHFDDRFLDADQPQEQPKPTRVPREIWVNVYPYTPLRHGGTHDTQDEANLHASGDRVECVHFREVL